MHANVPVRFGRGRLDSLETKGLAAYLMSYWKGGHVPLCQDVRTLSLSYIPADPPG